MTCDLGGAILDVYFSKLQRASARNSAFRITKPSSDYLHRVQRKKNWLLVEVFLSALVAGYVPKIPENFLSNNILNPSLHRSLVAPTSLKLQTAEEPLIMETYDYFMQIRDKTLSIGKLRHTLYPHTTHTLCNACPK